MGVRARVERELGSNRAQEVGFRLISRDEPGHVPRLDLGLGHRRHDRERPREGAGLFESIASARVTVEVADHHDDLRPGATVGELEEDSAPQAGLRLQRRSVDVPVRGDPDAVDGDGP
jgi:hypothetical protein